MTDLAPLRQIIRDRAHADEATALAALASDAPISDDIRTRAVARATGYVEAIRNAGDPALMEAFLAEYGLSTEEGVALMCLAEALLRVPDDETIDALIEDKIVPSAWGEHLGKSSSSLVNASTWALMLTGRVLDDEGDGMGAVLRGAVRRLGEPVIRLAVERAIKEMGHQFVLGRTIKEAVERGHAPAQKGYTFSYDMLGEAALTADKASSFFHAYADAIDQLAPYCKGDIRSNPGVSIKLSALHPRYERAQQSRVLSELTARTLLLAQRAKQHGMGLNIDAEEADRLDLSLDVIERVLSDPSLAGWDGFGIVVQAYGKRAGPVLDWLHALAERLDRKIMVRLVKGAYWDSEIKHAQVDGHPGFPVYTRKAATDVSYIRCAQKLLSMTDRIFPQFATHNAHTMAAILEMARNSRAFEFQRLHGMGEALHDRVLATEGVQSRIYAPVGAHSDLLAYLVRRLLENGANSSFVNQIVDEDVPAAEVAADPFDDLAEAAPTSIARPSAIFPGRANSQGWDLSDEHALAEIEAAREPFHAATWSAAPLMASAPGGGDVMTIRNPFYTDDVVGEVTLASDADIAAAISAATPWSAPVATRAETLRKAADLYEANFGELFALLAREAGKTVPDAIAELREAVDFLRYYADEAERLGDAPARGIITCISPWNFPLAIFTGQLSAALAAGNAVLAKPAEATPLVAYRAIQLLHEAGVPVAAMQLLPGLGATVGAALTSSPKVDGVTFTGSTATAQRINRTMADHMAPTAPLTAETGGLNAMIVDSTALPEQAVQDIIISAFQSAGQRCSALRVLYLQEDIAEPFQKMLFGAMEELIMGDPWRLSTDVGPVIDQAAQAKIISHIEKARGEGRMLKQLRAPGAGWFVAPTALKVNGIADLAEEIFGPVLHIATFKADEIDKVVDDINAAGFGLTFGLHTRIDSRVEDVSRRIRVGNVYVNRNQIGAVVGSQPFGGEGLSGTGPKAGGPEYVARMARPEWRSEGAAISTGDPAAARAAITAAKASHDPLDTIDLPGPTGESNRLSTFGRGVVLCLGPGVEAAEAQSSAAREVGCAPVKAAVAPEALTTLTGFSAVISWADEATLGAQRRALASREGAIIPLIAEADPRPRLTLERHVCIDTTASGGDAALLSAEA